MSRGIALDEAIGFVWKEADLLDRREYRQWLDLWAPEGLYIVPVDPHVDDPANALNYVYDDAEMRRLRVARLASQHSTAVGSAAATVRTVSRFVQTGENGITIQLRAAQHLAEYRRGQQRILPATLEVELRREGNALKYTRKVVSLIHSQDGLSGIAYLL